MRLFQTVVFILVMWANVYWKVTPNGYLAALFAVIIAFLATLLVVRAKDALARRG